MFEKQFTKLLNRATVFKQTSYKSRFFPLLFEDVKN